MRVGPIHFGDQVVSVQKLLGRGWRGTVCDQQPRRCSNELVYTDGVDQLQLWLAGTKDKDEFVDLIVARENRAQGGELQSKLPLREWTWSGGTLFTMPRSIPGWKTYFDSPFRATYDYGHGFSVWFTKNAWHGVDFHMFSE